MRAKNEAENVTMVLYPNDVSKNGKELRLRQRFLYPPAYKTPCAARSAPSMTLPTNTFS